MGMMDMLGVDGNMSRCTGSFMSERKVSLVVDGHQCDSVEVVTGVPQRSPVSSILFAIDRSESFKEVEEEVKGYMATSFVDNCGLRGTADSVA